MNHKSKLANATMQHLTEEKLGEECRELYRLALLKGEGQLTAESVLQSFLSLS